VRKLKIFINDILYVSKKTGTNNKKLLILASVLLSNLNAAADIGIIILFTKFFSDSATYGAIFEEVLDLFFSIKFFLPLLIVSRFVFVYFQNYILKILELRVQKNLKTYLLSEVFDKSNYSIADAYFFINTLTGHIGYFYSALASFLNFFIQTLAYLIFLIYSDQRTVITFGIGALILFLPSRLLILKAREFMHKSYLMDQKSNKEIQKIIENMFVIKILNKTKDELNNFTQTLENYNKNQIKNYIYGSFSSFLPSFVTLFVFAILLTMFNLAKTITLDFIGVTLRLFQALGSSATAINRLVNSHVHIEQFYKIDNNRMISNKDNFIFTLKQSKSSISAQKVNFKYFNSDEYIFEDLNIEIEKNTHNIIVGPNGSGKSTLMGLLAGILYPESGKIYSYEETYGYIGPVPLIFSETLKYNLLYGNENKILDEEIISLCRDFDLFNKFESDTLQLKINNKNLSSGQMQKISFIRAVLLNPNVLFLDEATSNLDYNSKKKVFDILKQQNITIVNSTHDPSSFKDVDNIFRISIKDDKRFISKV
jgi:ABC-type multidrug transport system fused ATPase/permease subunit